MQIVYNATYHITIACAAVLLRKKWAMKLLTTAKLDWLDDGCCDVKYLDIWNNAPLSYQQGQPIDDSWHVDTYELSLGVDKDGRLFKNAADQLMRYQFYPDDLLSHTRITVDAPS